MSEVAKGCSHYLEYKKAHGLQSYRIIYRYLVKPSSEARKLKVCGVTEKLFEFCGPGLSCQVYRIRLSIKSWGNLFILWAIRKDSVPEFYSFLCGFCDLFLCLWLPVNGIGIMGYS